MELDEKNPQSPNLKQLANDVLDVAGEGIGIIASPATLFALVLYNCSGGKGFSGYVTNLPTPVYIDTYVETYQNVKIYYNSANYYWAETVSLQGIHYLTLQQAEAAVAALIPPIQQPPSGSGYIGKPNDPVAAATAASIINQAASSIVAVNAANEQVLATNPSQGVYILRWNPLENYVEGWSSLTQTWQFVGWIYTPTVAQQIADLEREMAQALSNPATAGQIRYLQPKLNTLLGQNNQ